MKVAIHNHVRGSSVGRFRATAAARDHGDCGCGCGGKGNCGHAHDQYTYAELGIDVTYMKGGYGRPKMIETRHYTVPRVLVDPRGYPPEGAFVATELRKQPGHQEMVRGGWSPEKAEGYYKREQRDVGRKI